MKTCEYCGQEFEPKKYAGNKQRFCTEICNRKWYYANPKYKPRTCKNCGRSFVPKRCDRLTFCTRECFFESVKAKPVEKPLLVCVVCGREFDGRQDRKYCSDECMKARERQRAKKTFVSVKETNPYIEKVCKHCGSTFSTNYYATRKEFCSHKCSKKYTKGQRRYQKRGQYVAPISINQVYLRDGGRCQLCGKKVNKKLLVPHPLSPTIDHIIPLSQGGTHEPVNVQLAHFICNSKRSAIGPAQLRLFG